MLKIQILGGGCAKCEQLSELTIQAANELDIEYEISKVKEIGEIVAMGVMTTPALVVNGDVKVSGKVPTLDEIKAYLQ